MKKLISIFLSTSTTFTLMVLPANAAVVGHSSFNLDCEVRNIGEVQVTTNWKFNGSQVSEINDLKDNLIPQYMTIDYKGADTSGNTEGIVFGATTDYYTNFPDPHFDRDDDDENGHCEEAEITILGTLTANRQYNYRQEFVKSSSFRDGIVVIWKQHSFHNALTGEYDTVPQQYEYVSEAQWHDDILGKSNVFPKEISVFDTAGCELSNMKQKINSNRILNIVPTNKAELDLYVSEVNNQFASLRTQSEASVAEHTFITPMVTFTSPISIEELKELLDTSGAELVSYQAKFINVSGEWCTMGSATLDEEELKAKANKWALETGKPHASYEGIVCAEVIIDVDNPMSYDILNGAEDVYFVDVSEYLYQMNPEYSDDTDTILGSYAWKLAEFTDQ